MDTNHSDVGFTARHLGFSKVHGQFKKSRRHDRGRRQDRQDHQARSRGRRPSRSTPASRSATTTCARTTSSTPRSIPKLKLVLKSIQWKGNKFTANVALTLRDVTKDVKFEGELVGVADDQLRPRPAPARRLRSARHDQPQGLRPEVQRPGRRRRHRQRRRRHRHRRSRCRRRSPPLRRMRRAAK